MSDQQMPASTATPDSPKDDVTHFGFRDVPTSQKAGQVAEVFHSVAGKYDLMNDLMSMGVHRLWKRFTIELSGVRSGHQVLDIAGGTGDLTMKFSDLVGPSGKVVLADINASMLKVGRTLNTFKPTLNTCRFRTAASTQYPSPLGCAT